MNKFKLLCLSALTLFTTVLFANNTLGKYKKNGKQPQQHVKQVSKTTDEGCTTTTERKVVATCSNGFEAYQIYGETKITTVCPGVTTVTTLSHPIEFCSGLYRLVRPVQSTLTTE